MTREEAIKELKEDIELYTPLHGTIDDVDRDLPDGRLITALEMGIKALEQEPCPNAISRSDMLDAIGHGKTYTSEELQKIIKALPPVNPQPKTGHWIGIDEEPHEDYECDKCGYVIWADENIEKFHYCPNCGAKMIEPQESEDKCKNCEYYHNPDYTRCHKCKAESEE